MRTATVAVVWKLAVQWESDRRSLADDPWLDDELAERFTERVRWVIETVLKRDDLALSAAELALLITFPYLYQAFWARQAVETTCRDRTRPRRPSARTARRRTSGVRGRARRLRRRGMPRSRSRTAPPPDSDGGCSTDGFPSSRAAIARETSRRCCRSRSRLRWTRSSDRPG